MGKRYVIEPGSQFGRLTVMRKLPRKGSHTQYLCKCLCGNETAAEGYHLRRGATKSCGCLMVETRSAGHRLAHGEGSSHAETTEHRIWSAMLRRCYNQQCREYYRYGGCGITVCDAWRGSYPAFLKDMGRRPAGKSLDRIDPYGNYGPSNCRWATYKEQANNKRKILPWRVSVAANPP